MKYLEIFENFTQNAVLRIPVIKKFFQDNLAYMLDKEFIYKIDFRKYNNSVNYQVRIYKYLQEQVIFNWENIKDDFIPFLELLNEKYTLDSYSPEDKSLVIDTGNLMAKRYYTIEELIDDTIGNPIFKFISFIIIDEK